jgi:DNA-binding response OmpR family regulator
MDETDTRVLVVDDERFFREAIREILEGEGLEVGLAENAAEGHARALDPSVGVLVLDIQLPDRNGLDVLRGLREERPELRVVVLSAHTDQEYVLEALRLGACDYLAKPLHEEELRLSVRRALTAFRVEAGWKTLRVRLGALAGACEALDREMADEPAAMAAALARQASELLDATKTSVMLSAPDGALRVVAAEGRKLALADFEPVSVGEGVAGRAMARGETVWTTDASTDPRFPGRLLDRYDTSSFAVAPLIRAGEPVGVLCATDRRGGASFGEEDAALLRLLASLAAPRLSPVVRPAAEDTAGAAADEPSEGVGEEAGLREDLHAELARSVCEALVQEVEPGRILSAVLRAVAARLHAAPVSLHLLDASSGTLVREAQWEGGAVADRAWLPAGRGLSGSAFETGLPVASLDPAADPRFDPEVDTPEGGGALPLLAAPVRFRGKSLGLCRVFASPATQARTAEVLGAALSAAVRNVLLTRSLVESIEEVARVRREARAGASGEPGDGS